MRDREHVAALVRAAQAGDERAFAALVTTFQDVAVAYAASLLRDMHLAEDATQEAFVDAYRAIGSLREPAAFPRWLRRTDSEQRVVLLFYMGSKPIAAIPDFLG